MFKDPYKENPDIPKNEAFNAKEQKDEAFKIFELSDIQEILQLIIEKRDKINSLKEYIHINAEDIDEVITPPSALPLPEKEGNGQWEQKKMFPRVLTLLYFAKIWF